MTHFLIYLSSFIVIGFFVRAINKGTFNILSAILLIAVVVGYAYAYKNF